MGDCDCGHGRDAHPHDGKCMAARCGCWAYDPLIPVEWCDDDDTGPWW